MGNAAVEEHVKLDKQIKSRITHHLAVSGGILRLVFEHEDVGADDIDIWIPLHVVHLCFDSLCHTYIVRVHSCNKISRHIESYLKASIERLRHAPILR